MRICAVIGCGNGDYHLKKWRNKYCQLHQCNYGTGRCVCPPPFTLHPFPTERKQPEVRKLWVKAVNRKDEKSGNIWQPNENSRICSRHFLDGSPTAANPVPSVDLGYGGHQKTPCCPPPRDRKCSSPPLKRKRKKPEAPVDIPNIEDTESMNDVLVVTNKHQDDHTYNFECKCSENCQCPGCLKYYSEILQLTHQLEELRISEGIKTGASVHNANEKFTSKLLKTDKKVRLYTGLSSRQQLNDLHRHIEQNAKKMRYWSGKKKVVSVKKPREFKRTPKKFGPVRKLTCKDELILVLMKLRLGLTNLFLADLFEIGEGTCSQIINTWVKFLAHELKPLVFWPDKQLIAEALPESMKEIYPNLRCTLDCTEIFIERPRNLHIQALTWSDYKKHNTAKFLVAIAPNGMISFLSKAWGGRASDRLIVQESGFLNLVDAGDTIMADRGFTIQSELLLRQARLEIPPPSSGLQQMTTANVKKTKKIANARIHVERAINRMKWFQIIKNTLPVNLLPLIDDIIVVTAALCNLLPPLIKS